jgi:hypothetical protein
VGGGWDGGEDEDTCYVARPWALINKAASLSLSLCVLGVVRSRHVLPEPVLSTRACFFRSLARWEGR